MSDLGLPYVRMTGITAQRRFGPKAADHPSVGLLCWACMKPMEAGDETTLVPLGPGDDDEAREKARAGRPYSAVAVEIHADCGGVE